MRGEVIDVIKWIKNIYWRKVLLTGFLYTVIAFVLHQLEVIITMKYYLMPEYFGLWSKLMMPKAGPPPLEFFITSLVFTFVTGVSLALVYYYVRDLLPKDFKKRVFYFADLMIATSFIFFTLPTYLLFNVPGGLLIIWFMTSFIILLASSFVFVKLIK